MLQNECFRRYFSHNKKLNTQNLCQGWATGEDIGSEEGALKADYLNSEVWEEPANYIAIVRHQQGVVDAVKVWQFKYWGKSLLTR